MATSETESTPDTPRTNAAAVKINQPNPHGCDQLDWPSFARRLERENAKLRDALGAIRLSLSGLQPNHVAVQCIEVADFALK